MRRRTTTIAVAILLMLMGATSAVAQAIPGALLLYPNYRGMIFDDRPEIVVEAPSGATVTVTDKNSGATVATAQSSGPASPVKINAQTLTQNQTYTVTVTSGGATIGTWSVKPVPAANRATMNISVDPQGRLLMQGKPRFVLGVYDSGSQYSADPGYWENWIFSPTGTRKLDGVNLNMYLNYHLGEAPIEAMNALMDTLGKRGVTYLQTGNCFDTGSHKRYPFKIDTSDSYVTQFGAHKGAAGYYIADECVDSLIPETKAHHERLSSLDQDSMTFGALLARGYIDPRKWVGVVDVLGTDPYPLYGAEGANGYTHNQVADFVALTQDANRDTQPVISVLQFFKFTSDSRWPTLAEERAHAVMSIVEGAEGLFWWQLGPTGLGRADATTQATQMANLRSLINELAALEPALTAPDAAGALVGNSTLFADPIAGRKAQITANIANESLYSNKTWWQAELNRLNAGDTSNSPLLKNAATIRTKTKVVNGKGYVFAYNYSHQQTPVTFTWHQDPGTITENRSAKTYAKSGNSWNDTIGPYESRIYVIGNGGTGGGTPTPTPEPTPVPAPAPLAATMGGLTNGATVSGTKSITVAATGGTAPYAYKVTIGSTVLTGNTGTFTWDTTTVPNGAQTVTATVTDSAATQQTATVLVQVTVANVTPVTATLSGVTNGSTVSGSKTLTVSASGGTAPYAYTMAVDGTPLTGSNGSFVWDTTKATNGTHTLTATATDSTATRQTATAAMTVTVSNVVAPTANYTATITYPTDGTVVTGLKGVGMSTTASWGKSKTFTLSVDGQVITAQTITGTTLQTTWDSKKIADGERTLTLAVAYNGMTATTSRKVTVANGGTAPAPAPAPTPTPTPTPDPALTAAISSPAAGATVSGTQTVSMASTGGSSTTPRTFTLEQVVGTTVTALGSQSVTGTSASLAWDTTKAPNGSATLKLTVTQGTSAVSVTRAVTVSNVTATPPPPTVTASFTATITYPAEGTIVTGSKGVGMSTTAPWGKSKTFTLSVDGQVITSQTITGTSLQTTWNSKTIADGQRTLTLAVTYNGATAVTSRKVTVANGGTAPAPAPTPTPTPTPAPTPAPTPVPAVTASISSPAAGATVSGTQTVSMASTGGSTTTARTYTLALTTSAGTTTLTTQSTTAGTLSYGWNTTSAPNGSATLTLTVTQGTSSVTTARTVNVSNTVTAPAASFTAAFTYPNAGATVSGTQSIGMSTTAPWSKAKTVTLSVDGRVVYTTTITGTTSWYSLNTKLFANGTRTLKVSVTYNGQTATATRTVTVRN